jgi:hypothetical protein
VRKSKWVERQIDEVLLTAATTTGLLYARRRARRVVPKVMVGTAVVVAAGAAAAVAVTGLGVLGVGGAAAWYRRSSRKAGPADGWQAAPAAPARPSFTEASPQGSPVAAE